MSYDWISWETADRLYRIDPDEFARRLDADEIEFIREEHAEGFIYMYSKAHVARHFPARDKRDGLSGKAALFGAASAASAAITEGVGQFISAARDAVQDIDDALEEPDGAAADPAGSDYGDYIVANLENFRNQAALGVPALAEAVNLGEDIIIRAQPAIGGVPGISGVSRGQAQRISNYCNRFGRQRGWHERDLTYVELASSYYAARRRPAQ